MVKVEVVDDDSGQVLRIPKEFRVRSRDVYLKRTPEGFVVMDQDSWESFYLGVERLSEDFMAEGRQPLPLDDVSLGPDR